MSEVKIDPKKCTNCLECVEVCPEEVYKVIENTVVRTHTEKCIGQETCGLCMKICPENAIIII